MDVKATLQGEKIIETFTNGFGDKISRTYIKGKCIGKGGFAKCYEFTNLESGRLMAAKIIPKENIKKKRQKQKLDSEIKIHKSLRHPNVVRFEHVFEDNENIYILLELCKNETLNEFLKRRKRLTEFEVRFYLKQMASALSYIQDQLVIHRDLKLGNLFLSDKLEIKVGDFGLAAKLLDQGERRNTVCGTPNYIAPEILEQKGHSFEVDIWSLGVVCYTLLVGRPPFETNEIKTTYKLIRSGCFSYPGNVVLTQNAKNLIDAMIKIKPKDRISLQEILKHPFLTEDGPLPEVLPLSSLACPPSGAFLRQFSKSASKFNESFKLSEESSLKQIGNSLLNKNISRTSDHEPGNVSTDSQPADVQGYTDKLVLVVKHLDYSAKYGVGYLLSNGDVGVYFNDKTSLVHPKNSKQGY